MNLPENIFIKKGTQKLRKNASIYGIIEIHK